MDQDHERASQRSWRASAIALGLDPKSRAAIAPAGHKPASKFEWLAWCGGGVVVFIEKKLGRDAPRHRAFWSLYPRKQNSLCSL